MKKSMKIMLLVVVCLVANAFGADYWAASGTEGQWYSPDGVTPTAWGGVLNPWDTDSAYIAHGSTVTYDGTNGGVTNETGAWVSVLQVGAWADYDLVPNSPDQDTFNIINGGMLYQAGWTYIGAAAGDVGIVNIDATSAWQSTSIVNIGYDGHGEINVYGTLDVDFNNGNGGLFIDNMWTGNTTGSGILRVYGGGVAGNWLELGPNGLIDLRGGTIRFSGSYWGTSWTDYLTPLLGTQIIGYGGQSEVTITVEITEEGDETVLFSEHPLQPDPAYGNSVPAGDYTLSWVLPDPNAPGGVVTCDVYFGSNPEVEANPKVVLRQALESVSVTTEAGKTYYWAIDVYDSSFSDTEPIDLSPVFTFNTNNMAPVVNAGDDVETWLVNGQRVVQLDGIASDQDDRPEPLTLAWTVIAEPNELKPAQISDPAAANPTITVTEPGTYTLQLDASDGQYTTIDTMQIVLYADACEHAKNQEGFVLIPGDINEDCIVDDLDLAILEANWLKSNYSTE